MRLNDTKGEVFDLMIRYVSEQNGSEMHSIVVNRAVPYYEYYRIGEVFKHQNHVISFHYLLI